ncbi:MAG TPA: hypothetical protein VF721_06090 [Pyrinomonadaceae bacterium]|jgi:hypothetical protein
MTNEGNILPIRHFSFVIVSFARANSPESFRAGANKEKRPDKPTIAGAFSTPVNTGS